MYSEEYDAKLAKAPRWVRDLVTRLTGRMAQLERVIFALEGKPGRSKTAFLRVLSPHRTAWHEVPLQDDCVRFRLDDKRYLDVSVRDGAIYVNGNDTLLVEPQASNAFNVRFAR